MWEMDAPIYDELVTEQMKNYKNVVQHSWQECITDDCPDHEKSAGIDLFGNEE